MTGGSIRKGPVLAVVVLLAMVLQLAVPLTALVLPDKPHRLGWQMYSGFGTDEVVVTGSDGEELDVPWQDVLPRTRRPELDWTRHLPEGLCAQLDVPRLTVRVGAEARTVTC